MKFILCPVIKKGIIVLSQQTKQYPRNNLTQLIISVKNAMIIKQLTKKVPLFKELNELLFSLNLQHDQIVPMTFLPTTAFNLISGLSN